MNKNVITPRQTIVLIEAQRKALEDLIKYLTGYTVHIEISIFDTPGDNPDTTALIDAAYHIGWTVRTQRNSMDPDNPATAANSRWMHTGSTSIFAHVDRIKSVDGHPDAPRKES